MGFEVEEDSGIGNGVHFAFIAHEILQVVAPQVDPHSPCRPPSEDDLVSPFQIVLGVNPGEMGSSYGSSPKVELYILVFDRILGIALMQRSVTIPENEFSPSSEFANFRVSAEIALGNLWSQLFRPVFGAPQDRLSSVIATFQGFFQSFFSAEASSLHEHQDLVRVSSLVNIQQSGASVQALGFGVVVVDNLSVVLGESGTKANKDEQQV